MKCHTIRQESIAPVAAGKTQGGSRVPFALPFSVVTPTQLFHVGIEGDARDRVSVALEMSLESRVFLHAEDRNVLINAHPSKFGSQSP